MTAFSCFYIRSELSFLCLDCKWRLYIFVFPHERNTHRNAFLSSPTSAIRANQLSLSPAKPPSPATKKSQDQPAAKAQKTSFFSRCAFLKRGRGAACRSKRSFAGATKAEVDRARRDGAEPLVSPHEGTSSWPRRASSLWTGAAAPRRAPHRPEPTTHFPSDPSPIMSATKRRRCSPSQTFLKMKSYRLTFSFFRWTFYIHV